MSQQPKIKISTLLTFTAPVLIEGLLNEHKARQYEYQELSDSYNGDKQKIFHANNIFNALKRMSDSKKLTPSSLRSFAASTGAQEFFVSAKDYDYNDLYKLKYVKSVAADGTQVFTDKQTEAMRYEGTFFYQNGVVIRLKKGYVPAIKKQGLLATVELLMNWTSWRAVTQDWVSESMDGESSFSFRVNGYEVCPLGAATHFGVDPARGDVLQAVLEECHIHVRED